MLLKTISRIAFSRKHMKIIALIVLCLCVTLPASVLLAGEGKRMDENQLCRKLEDSYKSVKLVEKEKGKIFDIHVEKLSYLVLVAGSYSYGSKCLDTVFSRIQKESPALVVPRFVMTPAELERFIDDIAHNDDNDLVYSAYQRKTRYLSELIADAKKAITRRSGFKFDPSVRVIHSQ